MQTIDLSDIRVAFDKAWNMPTRPRRAKYKEGDVIDEDKSVRWNREEIARRNKAYDEEWISIRSERNNALCAAHELAEQYIIQETHISAEQARTTWSFIREHGGSVPSAIEWLDEFIEFIDNIQRVGGK